MSAREEILARLRVAQARVRLPRTSPVYGADGGAMVTDDRLERFEREAVALGISCDVVHSADAVRERLASLVGSQPVLAWDHDQLPYDAGRVVANAATGRSPRAVQAAAAVGVTGADAAISETGSLALFSGPGRSRAVSLLPPWHIAIVRRDDICQTMGEFFERHRTRVEEAAGCVIITGPSRTADIELTLTLGIHGPGRVTVIVGP